VSGVIWVTFKAILDLDEVFIAWFGGSVGCVQLKRKIDMTIKANIRLELCIIGMSYKILPIG
jgi:hypothetical protein